MYCINPFIFETKLFLFGPDIRRSDIRDEKIAERGEMLEYHSFHIDVRSCWFERCIRIKH